MTRLQTKLSPSTGGRRCARQVSAHHFRGFLLGAVRPALRRAPSLEKSCRDEPPRWVHFIHPANTTSLSRGRDSSRRRLHEHLLQAQKELGARDWRLGIGDWGLGIGAMV